MLFAKLEFVSTSMHSMAVLFPRLVILSIYVRIFSRKELRVFCYLLMALNFVLFALATVVSMLQCRPLQAIWMPTLPGAQCLSLLMFWTYLLIPSIVLDVIMIILPIPTILKLKASRKDKIGLVVTFAMGLWLVPSSSVCSSG